jgi:cell division initiation protein
MDITPQVINEVEFRRSVRGYDLDEVDDFLERMAAAVGQLLDKVRAAEQRAAAAEQRLAEAGDRPARSAEGLAGEPVHVPEADTISRALIAAQRTADALVAEARDEATRVTTGAQDEVRQRLADAQEQAKRLVAEAEAEAEHAHAESRQRVLAEISQLEAGRDALKGDVTLLEAHFEEQRLRLRSSIDELHRLLDDPTRLRLTPVPELSVVSPVPVATSAAMSVEPDARGAPDVTLDEPSAAEAEPASAAVDPAASLVFDQHGTDAPRAAAAAATAGGGEDDLWDHFTPRGDDGGSEAPPAQPFRIDDPDTTDDAYLAELRRAMVEDADEFGPTANLFGSESEIELDPQRARTRFGRRR